MRLLLLLSALALLALAGPAGGGRASAGEARSGSVVLELFTSQGCSSCPPADRLLPKLARSPELRGKVIPLAFHVDYWNRLGWRDPFSSPRWSDRQRGYARALGSDRIYTPQLVIDGRAECVGGNEGAARREIAAALAAPAAGRVSLTVHPPTPEGHLRIEVTAEMAEIARKVADGELDLWVAIYQNGLTTPVESGENASRTLANEFVVRRLERAAIVPGTAGARRSRELVLGLDKRWPLADLGVAAFLQDPRTLAIHGAAARPVAAR